MRRRNFVGATLALTALGASGCIDGDDTPPADDGDAPPPADDGDDVAETTVDWGESLPMGDGEATTYAVTTDGEVTGLGVRITEDALEGMDDHVKLHVDLPDAAAGTPFEFVGLDWAPDGHEPPGVYDVPHFDVHFYTMPEEEVDEIPHLTDYDVPIAEDQMPPDYVRTHEVVPRMGEHLVDPTAPEFGEDDVFTHTFIWGAYEGNLNFYEPMVTNDFLEQLEGDVTTAIKMPERFPEAGGYPTRYSIRYEEDDGAYDVELHSFEDFDASDGV